jgi:hypothetical protein
MLDKVQLRDEVKSQVCVLSKYTIYKYDNLSQNCYKEISFKWLFNCRFRIFLKEKKLRCHTTAIY